MKALRFLLMLLAIGTLGLVATSCEEEAENEVDGVGANFVRLPDGAESSVVVGIDLKPGTVTVPLAEILRDANSESALSQSVIVNLKIDQALINAYNKTVDTADWVELLPASLYQADPLDVNMAAGDFSKFFSIKIDPTKLDASKKYAIGLSIAGASNDYKVRSGLGSALYSFIIKNEWDGTYASVGTRYNYNTAADASNTATFPPAGFISTAPWDFVFPLVTVNGNTVSAHAGNSDGGFGTMNLTINPDNSVTIAPNATTALANLVTYAAKKSTYDPATKTFEIYYQWTNTTGTHRVAYNKLVRK